MNWGDAYVRSHFHCYGAICQSIIPERIKGSGGLLVQGCREGCSREICLGAWLQLPNVRTIVQSTFVDVDVEISFMCLTSYRLIVD